jgi:hypothetical protein
MDVANAVGRGTDSSVGSADGEEVHVSRPYSIYSVSTNMNRG